MARRRTSNLDDTRQPFNKIEPLEGQELILEEIKNQADRFEDADMPLPFMTDVYITISWTLLFLALHASMDLAIHRQYSMELVSREEVLRLLNFIPGLSFIIFYTTRYRKRWLCRAQLFLLSALGGSYMIHLVNNASYTTIMARCPSIATLWIWAIVRMELIDSVLSLLVVGSFVKWKGLKLG